jgi:uncharacterized protein (TIGR02117 family)
MKTIKIIFKRIFVVFGLFLAALAIYAVLIIGISFIPSNSNFKPCFQNPVEIYIKTNGVHTDIVLPLRNGVRDWSTFVNAGETRSKSTDFNHVAFGWGDKGFYLETSSWSDLKFKTAFNACFSLGTCAMHVNFFTGVEESKNCKRILINEENYKILCRYVERSFLKQDESLNLIKGRSYGANDLFYDAEGSYSMFYTCNSWVNEGLKEAGIKSCLWTIFDFGIFNKY